MDTSTQGVTLLSGFIFDIIGEYAMLKATQPLRDMAKDLDPTQPDKLCDMQLYNEVCQWVEEHLGLASLRKAGRIVGERVYKQMLRDRKLNPQPQPLEILRELQRVASQMIRDPKGRGWEILKAEEGCVRMRRTQSFNCMLQDGLLSSLVERTSVRFPRIVHELCTRRGDAYCEYEISWLDR